MRFSRFSVRSTAKNPDMSAGASLREFINERLSAAAEEIFQVFRTTIVEYEEEIERQRKTLDVAWKSVQSARAELPQQQICRVETDNEGGNGVHQRLCDQDWNSGPDPAEMKEEEEQLCISEQGEQLSQRPQRFSLNSCTEKEPLLLLHNSNVGPKNDPVEGQHEYSIKSEPAEGHDRGPATEYDNNVHHGKCTSHRAERPFKCDTCGKSFVYNSALKRHLQVHTGERPFSCKTCGRAFPDKTKLSIHMRSHTGETPHLCHMCGKDFAYKSHLIIHMRVHTGEKPFSCSICGRAFSTSFEMRRHRRLHNKERR